MTPPASTSAVPFRATMESVTEPHQVVNTHRPEGHGARLTAAFDALERFPALAESRNRVLALVSEDRPSTGDVVAAIESDVALVIAVLRLANGHEGARKGKVESVVESVEVLSPEAGKVTNIQAFTPGATIQTGQPILDLVPLNDRLVIEGRVKPTDIEQVAIGQQANIRLSSYRTRNVPMLQGQVIVVGADVQVPPNNNGDPYFLVRVEFDPGQLDSVPDLAPVAGMPAELYILGERRTPFAYLWGPLSAAARRALRD